MLVPPLGANRGGLQNELTDEVCHRILDLPGRPQQVGLGSSDRQQLSRAGPGRRQVDGADTTLQLPIRGSEQRGDPRLGVAHRPKRQGDGIFQGNRSSECPCPFRCFAGENRPILRPT
jgi:hypothetical protein